jgi:hypothetical protein
MKNLFLSFVLLVFAISANAQLIVDDYGRIAIGVDYTDDLSLQSQLSISGEGRSDSHVTIDALNKNHGLYIVRKGGLPYTQHSAITAINDQIDGLTENVGIYTTAYSATPISSTSKSFGLYAKAGNCNNGNYGVCGILGGTKNGAGIYGTIGNILEASTIGDRYAGFFYGNVRVYGGTLTATDISIDSDYRYKENIKTLDNSLDQLMKMNVVSYNIKQRSIEMGDSTKTTTNLYEKDSPILKNTHYGLIAQELQKIYPDLVIEDGNGYLSVNYIEIIPLLIQSVQELKAQLDARTVSDLSESKRAPLVSDIESVVVASNTLEQNIPNPFNESTTIGCCISDDVINAVLYIYDMNGKQIYKYQISERGNTSVEITAGSLSAGIYMYSLITDGKVIDTKRMILTE